MISAERTDWAGSAFGTTSPFSVSGGGEYREGGTILVVDDDEFVRTVIATGLKDERFFVKEAETVESALFALAEGGVDAVITDILMPALTGLELLRMIRKLDMDIPVVLITGSPTLDSAVQAVEAGAFRYLTKSAGMAEIAQTMAQAVQLGRLARWRRQALLVTENPGYMGDRAGLELSFEDALDGLWLAAQPIVHASDGRVFGVELLTRTVSRRFTSITSILKVAERLDRIMLLGRRVRQMASLLDLPRETAIFVNLHSLDLDDEELYSESNPLCQVRSQVILEVTERQALDRVRDLSGKIARLRGMGFQIAIDDMGSGYSGLNSFAVLKPDLVKVDMAIVRGLDADPYRRTLIRSLAALCKEFGIPLVAEGVETEAEKACLIGLGCDYLQGFLCGRPEALRLRSQSADPPATRLSSES